MIYIRKSNERGRSQHDWLDSYHTFSFADYHDPGFMGFGSLRVINEDTVKPGMGFGKHPHHDMEIISYVIDGALEHKDSMGTGSVIKPGEIQKMSAGEGVQHSEFNHSQTDTVHFLQIWIIPEKQGIESSYEQKTITQIKDELILIGSNVAKKGLITIHQDVQLYVAYTSANHNIDYDIKNKRGVWIQLIKGELNVNKQQLMAGDGAAIFDEDKIDIQSVKDSEFLLFDLKMVE